MASGSDVKDHPRKFVDYDGNFMYQTVSPNAPKRKEIFFYQGHG